MKQYETGESKYYHIDSFDTPEHVAREHVVTSARVKTQYGHDHVTVWNRGGNSGTLIVNAGDGEEISRRLLNDSPDASSQASLKVIDHIGQLVLDRTRPAEEIRDEILAMYYEWHGVDPRGDNATSHDLL